MIVKKLSEQDLNNFILNQVSESRFLEYKSHISLDGPDKYEFCRDVAAFANTEGGHIIYGINEENGQPVDICKITDDIDNLQNRISQILKSVLEPKLLGYYCYAVSGCLVIYIRKSWNAPHAVKLDGTQCKYQFPYRTESGKQYYDVHTLKEKIMEYNNLITDIKSFVNERINIFRSENGHKFKNKDEIFVLVHLIPISSFYNNNSIDVDSVYSEYKKSSFNALRPFKLEENLTFSAFPNLDGLQIKWDNNKDRHFINQIFRNATIEACFELNKNYQPPQNLPFLDEEKFQTTIIDGIKRFTDFLNSKGIPEPISVSINIFNIKNCYLGKTSFEQDPIPTGLTREQLNLGNIEIKFIEIDQSLQQLFKIFYNAFGLSKPQ